MASSLKEDIIDLYRSELGADVTFEVHGRIFRAHTFMLSAWSEVLDEFFKGPEFAAHKGNIKVDEFSAEVFDKMLLFVYSGTVDCRDIEELCHLIEAGERYGLKYLKPCCEAKLCETVNLDTIFRLVKIAEQFNFLKLRMDCAWFVIQHKSKLVFTKEYIDVMSSSPTMLDFLAYLAEIVVRHAEFAGMSHKEKIEKKD